MEQHNHKSPSPPIYEDIVWRSPHDAFVTAIWSSFAQLNLLNVMATSDV